MTHAVGLRTYQIFITQKGSNSFISPTDPKLKEYLGDFLKRFIAEKGGSQHVAISERNWSIQQRASSGPGESTGSISYGRYGYAASLRDVSTGIENYKKKRTDAETLQLYYRFWLPDHEKFLIAAFESFSGKSCISLIFESFKHEFEKVNDGFLLKIHKLMPSGASAKIYAGKPVKNLTVTTRKPPNDLADKLFRGKSQKTRKMNITIFAGRNNMLGDFTDLINGLPQDESGVISYDGIEFEKAVAMVKVGDQIRPVGVFGANSDVVVIDITEEVIKNDDGVPTFESVNKEASRIMGAIYDTMHGKSS